MNPDHCGYIEDYGEDPCLHIPLSGTNRCARHLKGAAKVWNVERTYLIPPFKVESLKEKIIKLNKRAVKLGCLPVVLAIEPLTKIKKTIYDPWSEHHYIKVEELVHPVTVVGGGVVKLSGWKMLARLDHERVGDEHFTYSHTVPGEECPEHYRGAPSVCDHCGHDRIRNSTFILRHDDERLIQVGSTCLKDFLGHDPESIVQYSAALRELSNFLDSDEDSQGRTKNGYELLNFLSMTAAVIREFGWISKTAAEKSIKLTIPTSNTVEDHLSSAKRNPKLKWAERQDEDWGTAQAAIDYALNLKPGSDYEHNIHTLARSGEVPYRQVGFAASMIRAYQRELEQKQAENDRHSSFFGSPGERIRQHPVAVAYVRGWDSDYGFTTLYAMKDDEGHLFIWKTTADVSLGKSIIVAGHPAFLTGRIKDHTEYRGERQTIMTRCKLEEIPGFDYRPENLRILQEGQQSEE